MCKYVSNKNFVFEVKNTTRMTPPSKWNITPRILLSDGTPTRISICIMKTAWKVRNALHIHLRSTAMVKFC